MRWDPSVKIRVIRGLSLAIEVGATEEAEECHATAALNGSIGGGDFRAGVGTSHPAAWKRPASVSMSAPFTSETAQNVRPSWDHRTR